MSTPDLSPLLWTEDDVRRILDGTGAWADVPRLTNLVNSIVREKMARDERAGERVHPLALAVCERAESVMRAWDTGDYAVRPAMDELRYALAKYKPEPGDWSLTMDLSGMPDASPPPRADFQEEIADAERLARQLEATDPTPPAPAVREHAGGGPMAGGEREAAEAMRAAGAAMRKDLAYRYENGVFPEPATRDRIEAWDRAVAYRPAQPQPGEARAQTAPPADTGLEWPPATQADRTLTRDAEPPSAAPVAVSPSAHSEAAHRVCTCGHLRLLHAGCRDHAECCDVHGCSCHAYADAAPAGERTVRTKTIRELCYENVGGRGAVAPGLADLLDVLDKVFPLDNRDGGPAKVGTDGR